MPRQPMRGRASALLDRVLAEVANWPLALLGRPQAWNAEILLDVQDLASYTDDEASLFLREPCRQAREASVHLAEVHEKGFRADVLKDGKANYSAVDANVDEVQGGQLTEVG